MGRGNVCTHHDFEDVYYLDKDYISVYNKVIRCDCGHVTGHDYDSYMTAKELDNAEIDYDYDGSTSDWAFNASHTQDNWRDMIVIIREAFHKRFKSFVDTDEFRDDRHIIMRNNLFEIAVVDGDWCAAWCLLEQTDIEDDGSTRALMRRHFNTYLDAIKSTLISVWGEAIGYGGAWTSGTRYTHKDAA